MLSFKYFTDVFIPIGIIFQYFMLHLLRLKLYKQGKTIILMTEVISIVSGKGGVGKTTIVANLAVTLTKQNKKVLVIDGNVSGPNLAMHLGIPLHYPTSLNDVLKEEAFVTQAIYKHVSGFSLIPASLTELNKAKVSFKDILFYLVGDYDYILIDAAAGINEEVEAAVEVADKVLIITNPELPALANAALTKKRVDEKGKAVLGVVLNKVRNEKYELSREDVENFLQLPVLSSIIDEKVVRESIALRKPVTTFKPLSRSARAINSLSYKIMGEKQPSFWDKVSSFLR